MVRALNSNVTQLRTKCGKTIEQFLNEHSKGSTATERCYRGDITRFLAEVFHNKTIDMITSEELDTLDYEMLTEYIETFTVEKNTTKNRHIGTIKEMYKYLKGRNILQSDISYLDLVKSFNDDSEEIEAMPIDVFYEYIEEAGKETHNAEVKTMLLKLAADQGVRLGALLNLTWSSFIQKDDGVVIKGLDKGNKKFIKVMSFEMYEDLLKLRGDSPVHSKVFTPLSAKNVTDMMIRIRKKLGYEERGYSFHSLRKTSITFEHRFNGGDVLETQRFSGHSNTNMLQTYVDEIGRGVRGMLSLGNYDKDAYKKVSHDELLEVIEELSSDIKHLINAKIQQRKS